MKKVIIAFDGIHYSDGAFEFARRLNQLRAIFLTAVFVPQAEVPAWSYAEGDSQGYIPLLEGTRSDVIERNIQDFEQQCKENNIQYSIHRDFNGYAITELKRESLYADLLLIATELFYSTRDAEIPNVYLKKLLHDVKCSVILIPETFKFPERIVIGYDGSENSVFALKQFAYVLPELTQLKTSIVSIGIKKNKSLSDDKQLIELAERHFSDYSIERLDLISKTFFGAWLAELKSVLFVCGSYGRSAFTRLIRKSFADSVIREYALPIFISHL